MANYLRHSTWPSTTIRALERNETLNLTLSGTGLTFGQSTATLTIRDNDFVPTSGNLVLNEIFINSPGNDPPHEFVELSGLAGIGMGSLYYVAIEGLVGPTVGQFEKIVDLGPYLNGSNGLSLLTPQEPGFAYNVNPATTQIQDLGTVANENVSSNNDSTSYLLLYSPSRELTDFAFDFDWDNDGSLELPVGATIVDVVGVRTLGLSDQVYGPTSSILSFTAAEVDSISRKRSDLDRNDGSAWFGGNLLSAGDDYLLYEAAQSTALPVTGAAMTPGDVNTGTDVQSPLVALTSVTPNSDGTITVSFDGPVSQVLSGDSSAAPATGSGISITDTNGQPIPIIDARPVVTGIGTSTLTLSFTGSGVVGGQLPAGTYQLNFVGNGIIANGRAVDVANNDTQLNGFFEFEFTVSDVPGLPGDYNGSGTVDAADVVVWRKLNGQTGPGLAADGDGDMDVDQDDYLVWRTNFGRTGSESSATIQPGTAAGAVLAGAAAEGSIDVGRDARDQAIAQSTAPGIRLGVTPARRASFGRTVPTTRLEPSLLLDIHQRGVAGAGHDGQNFATGRPSDSRFDEYFSELGDSRMSDGLSKLVAAI